MKLSKILTSFLLTLVILIVFNICSTVLLPDFGLMKVRVSLNILIVIFMGLRVGHFSLPILILFVQLVESSFTVEGWAHGTFAGVLISIMISLLKDVLHLKSAPVTIVISFILQLAWFFIESFLVLFRLGDINSILYRLQYFIIESIILALLSPVLFKILGALWKSDEDTIGVSV